MLLFIYYKSALLLIFFGQALVLSALLFYFSKKFEDYSAGWLATLLILAAMYVVPWMLGHEGWYSRAGYRDLLFFVPFQQFYLIGPVIYFYVRSLLNANSRVPLGQYVFFIPAALYLLYSLVVFVFDFFILDEYFFYSDGMDKDLALWYQLSGLIFILFFTAKSVRKYQAYRRRILDFFSYADSIRFIWLKRFLTALAVIILLRILFFILFPGWGDFGQKWWYYFGFAVVFYYIGMAGLIQTVQLQTFFGKAYEAVPVITYQNDPVKEVDLAEGEIEKWKEKIKNYLDEGGCENPRLSLDDVAKELGTTPKMISKVVNVGFQQNFNDLVNRSRIEKLVQLIHEGAYEKFSFLGLALQCGFNSKTTFNRAFKKFQMQTPQEFIKSLKQ